MTTTTATTTGATAGDGTPAAQPEPITLKQIEDVLGTAARDKIKWQGVEHRASEMWHDLAATEPDHPLHVKPGDPHWHVWISAEHDEPGTAETVFAALQDAAGELVALLDGLDQQVDLLESKRDALHELDDVSMVDDLSDPVKLMAKLTEIAWNIKEAARLRRHADRVRVMMQQAGRISNWAYQPPLWRSAPIYARGGVAATTRLLRRRAFQIVDDINVMGRHAHGSEGGGFRIVECEEADCEIAARAHAESNEAAPVAVESTTAQD